MMMEREESRLDDPAPLASPEYILVVLPFAVIHIWGVQAIEGLASNLISPPEVLQVVSNRLQELILVMAKSVQTVELQIELLTLTSFIRDSHMATLSKRFFFSLC